MDNETYADDEPTPSFSRRRKSRPSVDGSVNNNEGDSDRQLKRQLGLGSGTALIVGTMIGSGIFISPGGLVKATGSIGMSLVVWLLSGVVAILGSLCYVELGCICAQSGGEHAYLLEAFGPLNSFLGPLPAFLYQWSSILILKPASFAIIMLAFSEYVLQPVFDACGPPRFILLMVTIAGVLLITFINCWSAKLGAVTQNLFTFIKSAACIVIVVGGLVMLAQGNTIHLATGFQGTVTNPSVLALAFYNGLWAYDGWNNLNYCTEELEAPHKNLPRAILIAIPSVTVVYLLMNVAYFTVLSPADIVASPAVAVSWANIVMPSVAFAVPVMVAVSTFGAANGSLFSAGRLCFGAAREGHAPGLLAMIHRRSRTPMPALLVIGLITVLMVITANISQLIDYFSFTVWFFYGFTFLALLVMRWTKPDIERSFRVPLVIPVVVFLISVYLVVAPIIENPRLEFLYAFLFVVSGVLVYVPFVYFKLQLRALDRVSTVLQLYLNVVPSVEGRAD